MKAKIIRRPTTFDRVDRVKKAVGNPDIRSDDDRLWILGQPLHVELIAAKGRLIEQLEVSADGGTVIVPAGFVTDGASVPYLAQLLTGWHPWDEPHRWGAIVHDWLYCMNGHIDDQAGSRWQTYPLALKPFADRAFRATLVAAGCSKFRATIMYLAVILFGGSAYRIDQKVGPTVRA